MSATDKQTPPVVGKRNHFVSLDEHVDTALMIIARFGIFGNDTEQQEKLRGALQSALRHFLTDIQSTFLVACNAGMMQAVALIQNPDYYEHRKQRSANKRASTITKHLEEARQRKDKELFGPTPEEVSRRRRQLMSEIAYYDDSLRKKRAELAALPNVVGPAARAM